MIQLKATACDLNDVDVVVERWSIEVDSLDGTRPDGVI